MPSGNPNHDSQGRFSGGGNGASLRTAGSAARLAGHPITSNPHPEGSWQSLQWRVGHTNGLKWHRQAQKRA